MSSIFREQTGVKLRNRLLILLIEKERREGRKITYTEVATETESSVNVISQWAKDKITRFDADMVLRLCLYFGCQVGDLLYIDYSEDGENSATSQEE
jgi:DNA-binding Xre family transcriptional regulator